jgi:hypothetical protein
MVRQPSVRYLSTVQKATNAVRKNPEVYNGYDPSRTLDDVDVYASTSARKPEPPTEFELYGHSSLTHKNNFVVSDTESIHSVKEGGYLELDEAELKKYLPDCITGEVLQEFEFSERKAWMIRDSTKLLCRLIEEFEYIHPKGAKERDEDSSVQPQTVSARPHLPGLTDRPERTDSVLQVYLHGNKISDEKRGSIGNYEITSGQGSLVESSVERILKGDEFNGPVFPRQIMVTGSQNADLLSCVINYVLDDMFRRPRYGEVVYYEPNSNVRSQTRLAVSRSRWFPSSAARLVHRAVHVQGIPARHRRHIR